MCLFVVDVLFPYATREHVKSFKTVLQFFPFLSQPGLNLLNLVTFSFLLACQLTNYENESHGVYSIFCVRILRIKLSKIVNFGVGKIVCEGLRYCVQV